MNIKKIGNPMAGRIKQTSGEDIKDKTGTTERYNNSREKKRATHNGHKETNSTGDIILDRAEPWNKDVMNEKSSDLSQYGWALSLQVVPQAAAKSIVRSALAPVFSATL